MHKLIKTVLVIVALVALAVYLGGPVVLRGATRKALPRIQESLRSEGFEVGELDFVDAGIDSYRSVHWSGVRAAAWPIESAGQPPGQPFEVWIDDVALELASLSLGHYRLVVSGLAARTVGGLTDEFDWASARFRDAALQGRLEVALASVDFEMAPFAPARGLRRLLGELARLGREGRMALPAEVYAEVRSEIDGEEVGVRLRAAEGAGGTALHVDEDDLRRQAGLFNRPLTDLEIALVAENPLRAPDLLAIKRYAERRALDARRTDPAVPEDAYRHVLWSYLLTCEFGAEFAEQVTDAHEIGSTTNTEAEHRMDYNNNAVGRRYAAEGVEESEILSQLLRDPAVILQAR